MWFYTGFEFVALSMSDTSYILYDSIITSFILLVFKTMSFYVSFSSDHLNLDYFIILQIVSIYDKGMNIKATN